MIFPVLVKSSKKKNEKRKRRRWLKHSFLLNEEWLGIETKDVNNKFFKFNCQGGEEKS